jgi:hypothetical protein
VFQTSHQLGTPAGYLMLALFLLLLLTVALPAVKHRRPAELNLAVLAAFALFVFIEGTLLVLTRNNILPRHAMMPIMFSAALIAALWRVLPVPTAGLAVDWPPHWPCR